MNTAATLSGSGSTTARSVFVKIAALVVVVIAAFGILRATVSPTDEAGAERSAPTFTLVDSNGAQFSSTALSGKVWVASFFFTSCDSVCPMVIGKLAGLFENAPKQIHFVSFSIDPTNDDPAALAKYAQKFDADTRRWHFLTGTQDQLRAVVSEGFQVAMPETKEELDRHSLRLVLVDQSGKIRGYFNSSEAEELARLKEVLEVYRGAI